MIEGSAGITPFDWSAVGEGLQDRPSERKLREVAGQFESLLIAQLMSSMRQADGGSWLGAGEDQAASTMTEMAEQCVAQAIASSGGLGLATLVVQGLGKAGSETSQSESSGDVSHRR